LDQENMRAQMQGFLVRGLPVIREGDDLASLIESLFELQDGDVLCIASTVVAKGLKENNLLKLASATYDESLSGANIFKCISLNNGHFISF